MVWMVLWRRVATMAMHGPGSSPSSPTLHSPHQENVMPALSCACQAYLVPATSLATLVPSLVSADPKVCAPNCQKPTQPGHLLYVSVSVKEYLFGAPSRCRGVPADVVKGPKTREGPDVIFPPLTREVHPLR